MCHCLENTCDLDEQNSCSSDQCKPGYLGSSCHQGFISLFLSLYISLSFSLSLTLSLSLSTYLSLYISLYLSLSHSLSLSISLYLSLYLFISLSISLSFTYNYTPITECTEGKYGDGCVHHCRCKNNKVCDFKSGRCEGGCIPGYMAASCNIS